MSCDGGGELDCAAPEQIGSDSRRPKRVIADRVAQLDGPRVQFEQPQRVDRAHARQR